MSMTETDLDALIAARNTLESPGLVARLSNLVGNPIEQGMKLLPAAWHDTLDAVVRSALQRAMQIALRSFGRSRTQRAASRDPWHKVGAALSGAVGGAFGIAGLAVELPLSTTVMLRSILDIARSFGEDLDDPATQMECVSILALGGSSRLDDGTETGYFAVRAALAKAVTDATSHIARHGLARTSTPALARLIQQVAARFSIVVTEKAAAQAVPLLGATGGAVVNTLFIEHFQQMARAHFTVRAMERRYGIDVVRAAYERQSPVAGERTR